MAAGGVYGKYENYFGLSAKILIVFACVYLTGSIWHTGFLSGHSSYNCDVQPLGFIWSMIGIITLIEICKRMPRSGFLTFIGRNSILFYFLSGAIPTVVSIVMQRISELTSVSMLLIYVISVFLAFFLARFIVSFFPFLKDVRNIGIKK
jgi:fucose 4-O-acetylase-like acetyltransferase